MNPFLLDARQRLADWKEFRKALTVLPEAEQLEAVAHYWAKAPLGKLAYDLDDPEGIPSAWEMVSAGEWCANSIAIGMEFTLRLAGWAPERLLLAMIRDYDISEMKVVLIIDGNRWLNYSYDQVSDTPTTRHDVIGHWRFSGKLYAQTLG